MIKKLIVGIAALLCLLPTDYLFSQEVDAPFHGIAAKVLFIDYSTPNSVGNFKASNGLELAYLRHIKEHFAVGVPVKIGIADLPGDAAKTTFVSIDAIGQYRFTGPESNFIPYGFAGLGVAFDEFQNHAVLPIGLGMYYKVGNNSFVTAQFEYRKAFEDNRDNLQLGLGWYYRLQARPLPPEAVDTDKDGIPDVNDRCPDEPGIALAFGCPDTDEDGVPNGEDDCPTEKGSAANKGCPSPGDRDADGIADVYDNCPDVPGPAENNGCPPAGATSIDTDGDGVTDDKDRCPTISGEIILFGCPDKDGDGVADKDDLCPDVVGIAKLNGCPRKDSDQDGIWDDEDACPTIKVALLRRDAQIRMATVSVMRKMNVHQPLVLPVQKVALMWMGMVFQTDRQMP
ncbi:MAG: thrombospondin type 3 repeat-containing protein [Saprospiraceae bacterium]